ncbi:MAG: prolipoprotein diacylglyceryl transferase [Bacteroidota bacterium]
MIDSFLNYVVWDPNPAVFSGFDRLRWYSLFFAMGFIISQQFMVYFFRKEGQKEELVDKLTIYMVLATIIGARLGHVLFYEPERYLSNPIDILKVWEGGLASHGAAIAILLALWLYAKRTPGQSYLWVVDRIVIVTAMTGALIRFGNLMNSEIGGKDTLSDSGFVYARSAEEILESLRVPIESIEAYKPDDRENELQGNGIVPVNIEIQISKGNFTLENLESTLRSDIKYALTQFNSTKTYFAEEPESELRLNIIEQQGKFIATVETFGRAKYPTQIYESLSYFAIFLILLAIWFKYKEKVPEGLLLGIFLITVFGMRFVWEFLKENQVEFEDAMKYNMGQILSIPLVIGGVILVIRALRTNKITNQRA